MGIIVMLAVGFFVYQGFTLGNKKPQLRKDNHCPVEIPISHITVLIVDVTDTLNIAQKKDVDNLVDKLVSKIPRYGAFTIYTVNPDDDQQATQVFFRCNPGRGDEIDPMTGNPKKVEKLWLEGFRAPLSEALSKNLNSGTANFSPIMESIQWVAIQEFEDSDRRGISKQLVVISDFLQHTRDYSHYRTKPDFSVFENSNYFRRVRTDLTKIDVVLSFVRRNSNNSSESLKQFWKMYFNAQGTEEKKLRLEDLDG